MPLELKNIDDYNRIIGYDIHDSIICGFEFRMGDSLQVSLKRDDSSIVTIEFIKVIDVGFVDFRTGAIVANIFAWRLNDFDDKMEVPIDQKMAWRVLFANHIYEKDFMKAIQNLDKAYFGYLVLIECSYGGSIACICNDILAG